MVDGLLVVDAEHELLQRGEPCLDEVFCGARGLGRELVWGDDDEREAPRAKTLVERAGRHEDALAGARLARDRRVGEGVELLAVGEAHRELRRAGPSLADGIDDSIAPSDHVPTLSAATVGPWPTRQPQRNGCSTS